MLRWPYEVATEDEAQDEHKDARPEDNHVDVERQVLEGDGRHGARLVGVNQSQTTEAPWTKTEAVFKNRKSMMEARHKMYTQLLFYYGVGSCAIYIVISPNIRVETQIR